MSVYGWTCVGKETDPWEYQAGPLINPVAPDHFEIQPVSDGLWISCAGKPYAGALAKHVGRLPDQTSRIISSTSFRFDSSIAFAQVIEIDRKFTDAAGWTYDGSTQWNFSHGGAVFQVDNPWLTIPGVQVVLKPDAWQQMTVAYHLDYVSHVLTVESVTVAGVVFPVNHPVPAKKAGWAPSEIVTQAQLCTGSKGGAYAVRFAGIGDAGQ